MAKTARTLRLRCCLSTVYNEPFCKKAIFGYSQGIYASVVFSKFKFFRHKWAFFNEAFFKNSSFKELNRLMFKGCHYFSTIYDGR